MCIASLSHISNTQVIKVLSDALEQSVDCVVATATKIYKIVKILFKGLLWVVPFFRKYSYSPLEVPDQILGVIFSPTTRTFKLKQNQRKQFENSVTLSEFINHNDGASLFLDQLITVETAKKILNKIYVHYKKKGTLKEEEAFLFHCQVAECLAKIVAYKSFEEGEEFSIPLLDKNNKVSTYNYLLDKKFDLGNDIPAFGFKEEADLFPPILLYQGADIKLDEEGVATLAAGSDPDGSAESLYKKNKGQIKKWLEKVTTSEVKAKVIGYSMGGTLACYTLVDFFSLISKEKNEESISFNQMGVPKEVLKQWEKINLDQRPAFKNIVIKGDPFSKFGYLFGDVYQFSMNKTLTPFQAHLQLDFFEEKFEITPVDLAKENRSFTRSQYQFLHKVLSPQIHLTAKVALETIFEPISFLKDKVLSTFKFLIKKIHLNTN